MRLSRSWIIASKDFKIFLKKKNIIYSILVVPLIVSFLFPVVIVLEGHSNGGSGIPASELPILLPAFSFFYLILAGMIPTAIASYSLIGEKVEKSLEPLLVTPTTDSEILLGKGIAAFLPPIGAILGGATIFMVLMDLVTHGTLGYYFFPNWNAAIVLFLMVPLAVDNECRMERHCLGEGERCTGCATDWNSLDSPLREGSMSPVNSI